MKSSMDVWLTWETCVMDPRKAHELSEAVEHILKNQKRYEAVGKPMGIPFWVIACIHYRESSFNFTTWLANGDPLMRSGRPAITSHVPIGLGPASSWESAAQLSIQHVKWHSGMEWDLVSSLIRLESYNGLGYSRAMMNSPYIWAGTNHYHIGKYGSDGKYDPALVDKQLGCAALAVGLKMHDVDLNEVHFA